MKSKHNTFIIVPLLMLTTIFVLMVLFISGVSAQELANNESNILELEFESFSEHELFSPFEVIEDEEASGGEAIVWPLDGNEQYNPISTKESPGHVIIPFALTETTDVTFEVLANFVHMGDDSFYYRLDDGLWGIQNSAVTNGYEILKPTTFTGLSSGSHVLQIVAREDGAKLDKIILTATSGYIYSIPVSEITLPADPTPPTIEEGPVFLKVYCDSVIRKVTHCASGSLYGMTETKPADIENLVKPLKPNVFTNPARAGAGYQQPHGAAIPVAGRLKGTTGRVMIRLADIFPGWPYQFTNMDDWTEKVTSVINDKKASGYNNFYGYEIWNEPGGTWGDSFNDFWLQSYNLIRSLDPEEPIIGPSYSYYNSSTINNFLSFCVYNKCVPDIVCWHELSSHNSTNNTDSIVSHIKDYRRIESSLGISERKISLNEYCDTEKPKEGCPGPSASMIAKFERYKIDSACITWWFVAYPGRLGSLLATDTEKGAGWWFYKWYGDMSGNMVNVTPTDESTALVDGFACVDSNKEYVSLLLGGNNFGTVDVAFNDLPSFIGSTANVKIEKVEWESKDTLVEGTSVISESSYNVSDGSIELTLNDCNNTDGYRVYITAGTKTSTGGEQTSGDLPKTGESDPILYFIFGILILSMGLVSIFRLKKE